MRHEVTRRQALATLGMLTGVPLAAAPPPAPGQTMTVGGATPATGVVAPGQPARIKTSCNLYSFNGPLTRGEMTLDEVITYCAELGFDAVDPTGYYFTGYPTPPSDAEIYRIKSLVFRLGLEVSGTGVRNDFAVADAARRAADVALVGRWVDVAARLGAPVLRVFDGRALPTTHSRAEAFEWIVAGLQSSVTLGAARGVAIVLQNHNDALKDADDFLEIRRRIPSPWFGLNVDIGSLRRTDDPYREIARLAPHAYTWQVKELVYRRDVEEPVDLRRIVGILRDVGYRGYVPLETLGPGDPREKIRRFFDAFRDALAR